MAYKKSSYAQKNSLNVFKALTFGAFMGTFICVVLMAVLAIAFVKMRNIPQGFIVYLAATCAGVGALASGYISTRILKINGLIYGVLSGFSLFLIVLISGVAVSGEHLTLFTLIKCCLMLLTGAIGGIFGVNKRSKAR